MEYSLACIILCVAIVLIVKKNHTGSCFNHKGVVSMKKQIYTVQVSDKFNVTRKARLAHVCVQEFVYVCTRVHECMSLCTRV